MPAPSHQAPVTADPVKADAAIRAFRDRVPLTRKEWDKLSADQEDFAFTVSGKVQADLVSQVWEGIDAAIEDGTDFSVFQDAVGDELFEAWGAPDAPRLEMVFRTGVNQAYNDGREEVFRDPAVLEARPYWRFELVDDDALCDQCGECEDVCLPADDPWWDEHRPCLHPNCRCSFSAMTAQEAVDEGLIDPEDADIDPEVADGFGSDRDEDYSPDMSDYPDEIADHFNDVLEQS